MSRFAPRGTSVVALSLVLAWSVLLLGPGSGAAQDAASGLDLGLRLQTQFLHSSVGAVPASQVVIRRAWLTVAGRLTDRIDGSVFADLEGEVQDAYVRYRPNPSVAVSFGRFKRAFDLFELQSMADINLERDGRIPGVDACAGVGGVCSLSRLTERLGYSARDVGLRVRADVGERVGLLGTLTNGSGSEGDENDAASGAGRVAVSLTESVRLGGNVSTRDHVTPGGETEHGVAWGLDVEVGGFAQEGVHLQAGAIRGDNWRNRSPAGPSAFSAMQVVLSYYRPRESPGTIAALEPLARVSWADPDTDSTDDSGWLLTPGFVVHFAPRNKIFATFDVYVHGERDAEWSFKLQSNLYL